MKKHYQLKITGKVQGVWYRASTQRKAQELGIAGFVCNKADGSVYAELEGEEELLKKMVEWCREGPPFARVTQVEMEEGMLKGFENFVVKRGSF